MKGKSRKESKDELVAGYKGKGLDWCANQLYTARKKCSDLCNEANEYRIAKNELYNKVETLREANRCLADILRANGIKARKLLVEYIEVCCADPGIEDECDEWTCEGCRCQETHHMLEPKQFYIWSIDNGTLSGITAAIERLELDAVRVMDAETLTVLYEYNAKQTEEVEHE